MRISTWKGRRGRALAGGTKIFPLSIHSSGRYLIDAQQRPFFLHGDTPWAIEVQLTTAQIDTYLNDRQNKGFNTILFEAIEHYFSSQTPAYQNVSGQNPFTTMTDFASPNESYWQRVDYIVESCFQRGMLCMINPAYLGFLATEEGWDTEVSAEIDADLQTYGAFLANRYARGNVVWCMGGDQAGDVTLRNKQWNIVTGIRSVRTTDLITGHQAPADGDAYSQWNGYTGFNLNNAYDNQTETYTDCGTAYGRAGPMPFFLIETRYENEGGSTVADQRRLAYTAILSGACGHYFGNNPIWGFGEAHANGGGGAAAALSNALDSTGARQMRHLKALMESYPWWKLEPKTDASLITTALGTGTGRIVGARASDGSCALIFTPTANFTVAMTAFTPSSVRGRWYDPATGTFTTASGSPYSNSGTQAFVPSGDHVLVLDAA